MFFMAKVPRIGHEHQAPVWGIIVVVLEFKAETIGENKLLNAQHNLHPNIFADLEILMKLE